MAPGMMTKWLDAQRRFMDIAQRAQQRRALHAVIAMAAPAATAAATAAATGRTRPRPTPRRGAAPADLAAVEGRDGRQRVRPLHTRLLR